MRSIKFPKMFNTNSTNVWKSDEYLAATKQNAAVLLQCERNELFGDPYFGSLVTQYMFDQNSYILRDVIADIVYTQLATFIPQLKITRDDVRVIKDTTKGRLLVKVTGINQIDYQPNTFNLVLFQDTEAIK
jgi:phage baseplate assembly protein W